MLPLPVGNFKESEDLTRTNFNRNFRGATFKPFANIPEDNLLVLLDPLIIFWVFKGQRQNPEIAKIGFVNSGEALNDLGPDSQVSGG